MSPTLEAGVALLEDAPPAYRARGLRRFAREHGARATAIGACVIVDGVPVDCRRPAEECVAAVGSLLGY